jgi:hypothetical protein
MDGILEKAAVRRFIDAANSLGVKGEVTILAETARTAIDAANGLGIEVGQIASSLIFKPSIWQSTLDYHKWSPSR